LKIDGRNVIPNTQRHFPALSLALAGATLGIVSQAAAGQDSPRFPTKIVAASGEAAPDGNGAFSSFGLVALNDAGQTAYFATLNNTSGGDGDDRALYRDDGTSRLQIGREGQPVPDGNGRILRMILARLSRQGHVAFATTLSGTSGGESDDTGIYRGDETDLRQVVREGQDYPDGSFSFGEINPNISLNSTGQVGFTDVGSVFLGDGLNLVERARFGQSVSDGGTLGIPSYPGLNDSGQLAFDGSHMGMYRRDAAGITLIARRDQPAPEGGTVSIFRGNFAFNEAGQVAFRAGNTSTGDIIYRGDGDTLIPLASAGQ
jgi:hypothetical protein